MLIGLRNPSRHLILATAAILLLGSSGFASGITNGSFEAVQITSSFSTNPADVPGWTRTGAPGDALLINTNFPTCCGGTNSSKSGDGDQFAILGGGFTNSGTAAWSQTIGGLTIGQTYDINFMMAAEGETPTQQLTVGMTSGSSTAAETFTSPVTNTLFWQNWGSEQYVFVATATSATLQFSVNNEQYDVGIDAVSIAPAQTTAPEPSTLLLLGAGLLVGTGLRSAARRKSRK